MKSPITRVLKAREYVAVMNLGIFFRGLIRSMNDRVVAHGNHSQVNLFLSAINQFFSLTWE
jgi:hypothetical protein